VVPNFKFNHAKTPLTSHSVIQLMANYRPKFCHCLLLLQIMFSAGGVHNCSAFSDCELGPMGLLGLAKTSLCTQVIKFWPMLSNPFLNYHQCEKLGKLCVSHTDPCCK